jgi:hypothetical protein
MAHRAFVLLVVPALVFACGGQTTGGADGGPGSSSSSGGPITGSSSGTPSGNSSGSSSGTTSGSSSGDEPVDATVTIDAPAPIVCMSNGVGGSSGGVEPDGGPPPCETTASESCSDGTSYQVDCQCPSATCTCSAMTTAGGSSGGNTVMYPGCPSCAPGPGLFALCGFPQ